MPVLWFDYACKFMLFNIQKSKKLLNIQASFLYGRSILIFIRIIFIYTILRIHVFGIGLTVNKKTKSSVNLKLHSAAIRDLLYKKIQDKINHINWQNAQYIIILLYNQWNPKSVHYSEEITRPKCTKVTNFEIETLTKNIYVKGQIFFETKWKFYQIILNCQKKQKSK